MFELPKAQFGRLYKLLYLANQNITNKWTMPIHNWANILNQLGIRFERRFFI